MSERIAAVVRKGNLGRWADRASWTLVDRGLFALSNFGLNVALARWMTAEAYGVFAVAFSIFLMLGAAYSSFLIGPMLVFGPGKYRERFESYLGLLIKVHMASSVPISLCLALVGVVLLWYSPEIAKVIIALALAAPFILLLWLTRRSCYVHLQPKRAAAGGAIYMALLMGGTYLLRSLALLSPVSALFLMAATSFVVAVWLAVRQSAKLFDERLRGMFAREIMIEHWRYGRWTFPAQFINDAKTNVFFFVLPGWVNLEATAALRALINLIMPISFLQHSLSLINVPIFVRARLSGDLHEKVFLLAAFYVVSSIVYGVVLVLFSNEIIELLYAGRYSEYTYLLWPLALLPVVNSVGLIFSSVLSALERPRDVFFPAVAGLACTITVGLAAVALAGVVGAVIGLLTSTAVSSVMLAWFLKSTRPRP